MTAALSFHDVSKHYRGAQEYRALRDDIMGTLGRVAGHKRRPRHVVKALDGVSLEIPEGQSFAIIGPNGAGKTTALKLATRITYPTSGRVRVRGRVGALIEVGTGMHPELSGRENINLYGRILGLTRRDIARRFDEIVDFAEIGLAIDQPVKQYSSGMQLRMGFSIAAHLEPDLLLVDEALAVGDAGFQAKSVERLMKLVREGRTIVFVSHNLYAVEMLCPRGVYLRRGQVEFEGSIKDVLRRYLDDVESVRLDSSELPGRGEVITGGPLRIAVGCEAASGSASIRTGEGMVIACEYECDEPGIRAFFHFGVTDSRIGNLFLASQVVEGETPIELGRRGVVYCSIPELPLVPRVYEVYGEVRSEGGWGNFIDWQPLTRFRIVGGEEVASVSHGADAPVRIRAEFSHEHASTPTLQADAR